MFKVYNFHIQHHMPSYNGDFVTNIYWKAKNNIYTAGILLYHIYNNDLNKNYTFFKDLA